MPWFALATFVASVASAAINKRASSAQNRNQLAWNRYNAQMQHNTDMFNIAAGNLIARSNAAAVMAGAEMRAMVGEAFAKKNADIVWATALYNDALMEDELAVMWDSLELDQELLRQDRARERGEILARQSASGTVMGQDSNADVITSQMTQEALDAFILRHGADVKAAQIMNSRAQGLWEAEQQVNKILFEGRLSGFATRAQGSLDAAAGLVSANISSMAGQVTANNRLQSGLHGAQVGYANNQTQIGANFMNGMVGAVQSGISTYYSMKTPDIPAAANYTPRSRTAPAWKPPAAGWPDWGSITNPGTSPLT